MKQAAWVLEISQYAIENEYYMVDIPDLLEYKAKQKNAALLEQLMIAIASNNRLMQEDEYKQFVQQLVNQLGKKAEQTFSREKFEQLRMMTNMGANRTK